jgi:DNA-binding transcriptional MerR regulator
MRTRPGQPNVVQSCDNVYRVNRYNHVFMVHYRVVMNTTNLQEDAILPKRVVTYRSGVAARLAGLSVETLRVWERRYNLSDTTRSAHGQRLYTHEQVRHLGLLKQLVDQGHAIGVLAGLGIDQLNDLLEPGAPRDGASLTATVALVGEHLIQRIASSGTTALHIAGTSRRLDDAIDKLAGVHADLLLIELAELDTDAVDLIAAVRQAVAPSAVVVLYRFCASATIRELRDIGCLVSRVPPELGELIMLCRAALGGQRLKLRAPEAAPAPRRLDEQALERIVTAGAKLMTCECPRHLADILMTVGSFERYSAQCASRNDQDAQLHRDLEIASGRARVILEAAMERLAMAEGLPLPGD